MAIVLAYPKIATSPARRLLENLNKYSMLKIYKKTKYPEVIINYGRKDLTGVINDKTRLIINNPEYIKIASNKLKTFNLLNNANIPIPEYTTDYKTALGWIEQGNKVIIRTLINSFKGKGIILADNKETILKYSNSPLFTKYIPKRKEYRTIVCNNSIIAYMRKIKKPEVEKHYHIRNSLYYNYVNLPDDAVKTKNYLREISLRVKEVIKLDFFAIDILKISNTYDFRILEINTAFGLGEKNAEKLAIEILKLLKDKLFTI